MAECPIATAACRDVGRRVNAKNPQNVAFAARQWEGIESANTAGHAAGHAEKQTANAAGRDDATAAVRRGARRSIRIRAYRLFLMRILH